LLTGLRRHMSRSNKIRFDFRTAWSSNVLEFMGPEDVMLIGYARTSTRDQEAGLDAQIAELKALGCESVYQEKVSSVGPRPALDEALRFIRVGDVLAVTKLDRLARSVTHMGEIVKALEAKGAGLRILAMGVDTTTAIGVLMLNVLTSVAQFEREMMLERQFDGIAKAKDEGKYKGRKPTARAKAAEVKALYSDGLSMDAIAARLGIGKGSVHRALAAAKERIG
jgi:DNA invertase Pin-like site-specific DNA recombinase